MPLLPKPVSGRNIPVDDHSSINPDDLIDYHVDDIVGSRLFLKIFYSRGRIGISWWMSALSEGRKSISMSTAAALTGTDGKDVECT